MSRRPGHLPDNWPFLSMEVTTVWHGWFPKIEVTPAKYGAYSGLKYTQDAYHLFWGPVRFGIGAAMKIGQMDTKPDAQGNFSGKVNHGSKTLISWEVEKSMGYWRSGFYIGTQHFHCPTSALNTPEAASAELEASLDIIYRSLALFFGD